MPNKLYWEDKRREAEIDEAKQAKACEPNKDKTAKPTEEKPLENAVIEKGDSIRLNGQTATGIVLELKGKQATVVFGSIKSTVALERLDLVCKKVV